MTRLVFMSSSWPGQAALVWVVALVLLAPSAVGAKAMLTLRRGPCIAMSVAWKRWQDWASVVIGILFFITPFAFAATAAAAAAYTAHVGGVLLVIAGLWNLATPDNQPIEWAELVLGVLIFLAPWVLGYSGLATIAWSAWIAGVVAVLLSGSVLYSARSASALASHA